MNETLNQALTQLRASLANPQSLDAQTLESLSKLADQIEELLHRGQPQESGLAERLQGWIEQLEAEHPEWTKNLAMIAERLADMGI
jgi:ABC-type transporter Mla subunit MlaD